MTEVGEENIVLEGFLCPICKVDFGLDLKLFLHFQEAHSEDQDLVKSFKDLFGKAKEKILKNDIGKKEERYYVWEPQEIGEVQSHFQYFKHCRNKWVEHFVMETNKTVVRLEKLLCNLPQDPNKRKTHEQTIVHWLDGKDVTRCPDCTKSFNITRRQHHCRLCGSIVCHECSCFLPLSKAYETINETGKNQLTSITQSSPSFRLCVHCGQVLENREQIKYRDLKPLVCDYYDKIIECRNKIENDLLIKFNQTYNLLKEGESSYLTEANKIRSDIVKLAETIDALSNRILKLENDTNSSKVTTKNIRLAMIQCVQSTVLAIPALPSLKEIEEIAQRKREAAEARLRNGQDLDKPKMSPSVRHNIQKNEIKLRLEDGWSPVTNANVNSDNPVVEQMNIIKNYIKQAKEAYRFDEVASLERNLQELNEEYFKMQNGSGNMPGYSTKN
ncbi:rabenosyn-5 [Acyrthosiphon pisum]|uniref:FYVE-type domain-containing protein n=1 Tax=Acyrthosiphon pisum TaxID=7029 RepID=A0A8R2ABN4_ACYPI|nr:rabenosyn-5 [Acyrthosiphon pisum]|eukprot:XP_001951022.1 PREDICTED: rabenosyn-5 [Acyrthosiphon pisum]